jgi:hypothetical protein
MVDRMLNDDYSNLFNVQNLHSKEDCNKKITTITEYYNKLSEPILFIDSGANESAQQKTIADYKMKEKAYEAKKQELKNLISYVIFIKIIFIINAQKTDNIGRWLRRFGNVTTQITNGTKNIPHIDTYCKSNPDKLACHTNPISTRTTGFSLNQRNIRLLAIYIIYSTKMIEAKLKINIPDFKQDFLNKLDTNQVELGNEYINLLNSSANDDYINNKVEYFEKNRHGFLIGNEINSITKETDLHNSSITKTGGKTSRKKSTRKRKQRKSKKSRSKKI